MLLCQVESKLLHCRITVWTLIFGVFGRKLFFLKWLTAIGRAKESSQSHSFQPFLQNRPS